MLASVRCAWAITGTAAGDDQGIDVVERGAAYAGDGTRSGLRDDALGGFGLGQDLFEAQHGLYHCLVVEHRNHVGCGEEAVEDRNAHEVSIACPSGAMQRKRDPAGQSLRILRVVTP